MTTTLPENMAYELSFTIPQDTTVPHLYPEAAEFQQMPSILATGFMVGLCEWACIKAINPHIDWPATQTLGTHVNLSHLAATPPGLSRLDGGTEDDGIAFDLGLSRTRQPKHQNGGAGQQQGSRFKKLKHDSPPVIRVTT